MRKAYYSDQEYEQLVSALSAYVDEIERIDNPLTKELVYTILQHMDIIHREGLTRMHKYLEIYQPEVRKELLKDFSFRHLLSLYDLVQLENNQE